MSMGSKKDKFYLHPAKPCSGIKDTMKVQMDMMDQEVYKRWEEKYKRPTQTDYEARIELEKELLIVQHQVKCANENTNTLKLELEDNLFQIRKIKSHWLYKLFRRIIEK
jgi:hypothetical protein